MAYKIKYFRCIVFAIMFALIIFCPMSAQAKTENQTEDIESHRVLFISSYSYAWSTVPLQIEGIQSELESSVTLDIEFMDTKKS